ncbi:hypothetical protein DL93DRAFT_362951 [Clavulina sp. PMI_390]|nr:hypothetical protein DL93DRAFT_362951 [Clavulina sp. PMI_390]
MIQNRGTFCPTPAGRPVVTQITSHPNLDPVQESPIPERSPSALPTRSSISGHEEYEHGLGVSGTVLEPGKSNSKEQPPTMDSLRAEISRLRNNAAEQSTELLALREENAHLKKEKEQSVLAPGHDGVAGSTIRAVMAQANLEREDSARLRHENDSLSAAIQGVLKSFEQFNANLAAATKGMDEDLDNEESEKLLAQFHMLATKAQQRADEAERRLADQTFRLKLSNEVLLSTLARHSEMRKSADAKLAEARALIPPPREMASIATATDPQVHQSIGILAQTPARITASVEVSTDDNVASHYHICVGTDVAPSIDYIMVDNAPSPTLASELNETSAHSTPTFIAKDRHPNLVSFSVFNHYSSYLDFPLELESRMQRRLDVDGFAETIIKLEQGCDAFLDRMDARAARKGALKPLRSSNEL